MVQKWVHINFIGGDPWVLPIWTAFNEGVSKGKFPPKTKEMSELALHLSTRLDMIPWLVRRLNRGWKKVVDKVKNIDPKYISTEKIQGYAYPLDDNITYNVLLDIDSFLFEIDSCCELITRFMRLIYNHVGIKVSQEKIGKKLREVINNEGKDVAWFDILQRDRNIFIHEAAPYIAIDLSEAGKGSYELIIMKENLKEFTDDTKFIKFISDFSRISSGFTESKKVLQKHVINIIRRA